MERDFTLTKYMKLCRTLLESGYKPINVREYLSGFKENKVVILRHDVDVSAKKALVLAEAENELGIKSTYYFRMIPKVFEPDVIKRIASLGHEVGYHYEVLDKARGNKEKAFRIFLEELSELRKICEIRTIAMHGNPYTVWDNKSIWRDKDFRDYGFLGEAYLSIDYSQVPYFTDTGRSWNNVSSLKDSTEIKNPYSGGITSTEDLITLIKSNRLSIFCINTHPKRWNDSLLPWLWELSLQFTKNCFKSYLKWKMKYE